VAASPRDAVNGILIRALRRIGEMGDPEFANRLAAEAYAQLRHDSAREAERINGVMHHLVRLERTQAQRSPLVTDDRILDVRSEPPIRRHALIFDTFGALDAGSAFVLVNDHDPKPLYYQFAAENAGEFSWDYLEQGPEVWRVRIGKTAVAETADAS
jgi:uncharacterized protein (DUF2249 family)